MIHAMDHGGHTLDAFDGFLPAFYSQLGFKETGRTKFNRDYAPSAWDYSKHGEPDIVFMSRDKGVPIDADSIRQRIIRKPWDQHVKTGRYFDDWDSAKAHSRGERTTGTYDPGDRGERSQEDVETDPGQRPSSGVPLDIAGHGYEQSLSRSSPLADITKTAYAKTADVKHNASPILGY